MTHTTIATQTAAGRTMQLSGEMLINLYGEPGPESGRSKLPLFGAPNAKAFASGMGSGPIRATREALGYAWALSGGALYYIDEDGVANAAAGLTVDTDGWACMSDDGQSLVISANSNYYVVTAAAATQTLTLSGNAVADETVTIDSNTYTWKAFGTAYNATPNQVLIGTTADESLTNLIAAINRLAGAGEQYSEATVRHPTVTAAAGAGDTMVITAITLGTAANSIVTTETMTNGSWGAGTMTGGGGWTVDAPGDPDFPAIGSVDFCDGYIVFNELGTGKWGITGLYDAASHDPLDFTTAEVSPDNAVRIIVDHGEVLVFGERTIEPYSNQGNADFPFVRVPGGRIERGCFAPAAVAKMDNSVFFIGDDRGVYRLDGYTPAYISNPGVADAMRRATKADLAAAEAWTYALGGHHVYVVSFGDETWCYDAYTKLWHQRQSGTALAPTRWRCQWGFQAFGKMLVGDSLTGAVGELDLDTHTEFSEARRVAARTPTLEDPEGGRVFMHTLELYMEMGVGVASGQGSAPLVMMRTSDDGGKTWSAERTASIGAIGQNQVRARWNQLGSFMTRIIEFAVSDPVKVTLFGYRHRSTVGRA